MIPIALIGFFIGGLVVFYFSRPRDEKIEISAAQFFDDVPEAQENTMEFRLSNLILSPPFYLQLLALLLLIWGLFRSEQVVRAAQTSGAVGVLLLVDRSASMSTMQNGESRMDGARRQIEEVVERFNKLDGEVSRCFDLAVFDFEIETLGEGQSTAQLLDQVASLEPRLLGTDLSAVRAFINRSISQEPQTCTYTHVVVVSDLPAPEWGDLEGVELIWLDIAAVVPNVGIVDMRQTMSVLGGELSAVQVDLAFYGGGQEETILTITGPDGFVEEVSKNWEQPSSWSYQFVPPVGGEYRIELEGEDAYSLDDTATIFVDQIEGIRVDWQIDGQPLYQDLGWQLDDQDPHLTVQRNSGTFGEGPTLIVGSSVVGQASTQTVFFFQEEHDLLDNLNFDVAEQLPIEGMSLPTDNTWQPVLTMIVGGEKETANVWIATQSDPPAAFIPTLPLETADVDINAFTTVLFFNALRWVLQSRNLEPLFTLTDVAQPEIQGNRLALHSGEGDTGQEAMSVGQINDIQPVVTTVAEEPIWPRWLTLAAFIILGERLLATYGGRRWQ